jgi:AcrR family transcriptional regulator
MMKARKPARTGRLPASEAAQIPDRLLDAATSLFIETGYAKTTMDAIARRAGASSKTVYSRFANKEEILTAVVRRLMDRAVAADEAAVGAGAIGNDPHDFLLKVGRQLAALSEARETAGLNRLIMGEAFQFPELKRLFVDLHDRAIAVVREPLEKWQREGVLAAVPQPRLAAIIFIEMVASIPRIRALLGEPLARRETNALVNTAVDLFLRGCGYNPRSG